MLSFTVTGLRDIQDRHGSQSTQSADASKLVSDFINKVSWKMIPAITTSIKLMNPRMTQFLVLKMIKHHSQSRENAHEIMTKVKVVQEVTTL